MEQKRMQLTKAEIELKVKIVKSMKRSRFKVNPHLRLPQKDRETFKRIQRNAKAAQISEHKNFLVKFLKTAREFCRDGCEIVPDDIRLDLREVRPNSLETRHVPVVEPDLVEHAVPKGVRQADEVHHLGRGA